MTARRCWVAFSGLLLLAVSAVAQTDAGNGVARVSFIRGEVTIQRGDSGDLTEAAINAPLVTGDRILTGPGSLTEVQFDYGNFVRLAPNSEVRMQELRPERYLVAVADGTASFSRVDDYDSEVEINTPSISVRPVRKGNYRVSVLQDGSTEVTVRDGQADIYSPAGVERLGENRTMVVRGDRTSPEFQLVAEVRRDEFDDWNKDRDRLIRETEAYKYVDRSIPAAYELDAYGSWVNVAPYGHVWRPRVAVGWAPYRAGRWAWVDYYGWNWVSYDPWGWAPYHYGRWFNSPGYGWCWWPGGRGRHYYAPAVVGFVGFDIGNVGIGFGFGNVGWVPLAPYEPFHHWWGGGWGGWYRGGWRNNRNYIDNSVNIVNNVNVTNIYRNARVNNGLTVVNGESFRRGASVNPVRIDQAMLRNGNVVRGQLPMAPDRGSLRYSNRTVERSQVASRLARTENRQFYARNAPSRVDRPNFETQRGAMEQVQQRAFGRGESTNGAVNRGGAVGRADGVNGGAGRGESVTNRSAATRSGAGVPERGGSARTSDSGRGTSTSPQRGSSMAQDQSAQRGGWRRFGEPVNRESGGGATTGRSSSGSVTRGGANSTPDRGSSSNGATTRGSSTENSGWRRFGEPVGRGSADQGSRGGSSATRRSDSISRGSQADDAGSSRSSRNAAPADSSSGWRSFGRGNGNADTGGVTRGSSGAAARSDSSRTSRNAASPGVDRSPSSSGTSRSNDAFSRGSTSGTGRGLDSGSSRGSSGSSQERVRVSPSIVRERGSGGGSSGSVDRNSGSGRSNSSGRGNTNRSSTDGSNWRRFDGGAASGIQAYGEPAARSSQSPSRSTADAYSGSSRSRSNDAFAGSAGRSTYSSPSVSRSSQPNRGSSGSYSRSSGGSYSAPSVSRSSSSSRGSYSAPSRSVYSGSSGSRSSRPTYSTPSSSRSGGSYGGSISRGGSSSRGGSFGGSVSRGGGSVSRSSGGGSVSRSGGGSRGGGSRGGRGN